MNKEKQPNEQEVENKDAQKPADEQTAEKIAQEEAEAKAKAEAEAKVNEEPDFYKQKLQEAEKLLEKKEEIIKNKNRALEAEKRDRKNAEENKIDKDALREELKNSLLEELKKELPNKEEILNEVNEKISAKDLDSEISKYARDNEDAKKLIKHYYESATKNSKLHTTLSDKVRDAALMANREVLLNNAKSEGAKEEKENLMAQFTGGEGIVKGQEVEPNDILDSFAKYNPERANKAKKYL